MHLQTSGSVDQPAVVNIHQELEMAEKSAPRIACMTSVIIDTQRRIHLRPRFRVQEHSSNVAMPELLAA